MNDSPSSNLFFNDSGLKKPKPNYVAWVDLMGARNAMSQSSSSSANHIGRIHSAILQSRRKEVRVYPVMDGAYITCEERPPIIETLRDIYVQCAEYIASTAKPGHRFLMRGGLAFGPVIHGSDITSTSSYELGKNPDYTRSLLFGMPMIQANRAEGFAPPFGLYLAESVRNHTSGRDFPLSGVWWKWWKHALPAGFTERLREHFNWCLSNWRSLEYQEDRVKEHYDLARQYFGLKEDALAISAPLPTSAPV